MYWVKMAQSLATTVLKLGHTQKVKSSLQDTTQLKSIWEDIYSKDFKHRLEGVSEFGRHGVLTECITRLIHEGAILDMGCGSGILAELLPRDKFDYIGVDISEQALGLARQRQKGPNRAFVCSRVENFDIGCKFDAIVFNEILYYLDYASLIKSASKWLRGPRLVLASIFDLTASKWAIRRHLMQTLSEPREILICNGMDGLRWRVIFGPLKN